MPELADFVFHRAQRSVYLIEGLRHALADLKRPDLIAMLDLVLQDASQAKEASQLVLQQLTLRQSMRALSDLQALAKQVEPRSQRLIARMVRHLSAS